VYWWFGREIIIGMLGTGCATYIPYKKTHIICMYMGMYTLRRGNMKRTLSRESHSIIRGKHFEYSDFEGFPSEGRCKDWQPGGTVVAPGHKNRSTNAKMGNETACILGINNILKSAEVYVIFNVHFIWVFV
jgi:hypothetical protein